MVIATVVAIIVTWASQKAAPMAVPKAVLTVDAMAQSRAETKVVQTDIAKAVLLAALTAGQKDRSWIDTMVGLTVETTAVTWVVPTAVPMVDAMAAPLGWTLVAWWVVKTADVMAAPTVLKMAGWLVASSVLQMADRTGCTLAAMLVVKTVDERAVRWGL